MLNTYIERMTNCGLRSEKAANLENVLSIKLSLKHSLSIFAIAHFQIPYKVDILLAFKKRKAQIWLLSCQHFKKKSPAMVVVLLAYLKIQIWLMSCWYIKSPDMVVVLLAYLKVHIWLMSCWHIKKSRHSCCLANTFKEKVQTWLLSC